MKVRTAPFPGRPGDSHVPTVPDLDVDPPTSMWVLVPEDGTVESSPVPRVDKGQGYPRRIKIPFCLQGRCEGDEVSRRNVAGEVYPVTTVVIHCPFYLSYLTGVILNQPTPMSPSQSPMGLQCPGSSTYLYFDLSHPLSSLHK